MNSITLRWRQIQLVKDTIWPWQRAIPFHIADRKKILKENKEITLAQKQPKEN
jgi:hypothetical protein